MSSSALQGKNDETIVPRGRLGHFALDIYPAQAGDGFDLVIVIAGGHFEIENATPAQVRRLLSKLEGFAK